MLHPLDDLPIHQTSLPILHPGSGDANHYDRFFFNGYSRDASAYFGVAMGLYPNRHVIDAAFSVVHNGEQRSVHASGRCPDDRTKTSVGPISVNVVQGFEVIEVHVDAPEHGLVAHLTWRSRTAPVEEPRFLSNAGTRVVFDYTRLTQWGGWEGVITVGGEELVLTPDQWLGCRDRSWGIRPVGERPPGVGAGLAQFYWLWAPVNFDDCATHFDVNELADGTRWHESGFVVPADRSPATVVPTPTYRLSWRPGTRHMASCEIDLGSQTVHLEPVFDFFMKGIGYFNPEWGHGLWKGELAVGAGHWKLADCDPADPTNIHVQTLCRATMGDRQGIGILETLVIGPHEPSGFTGLFDGAS